jgi:hypothetical protein
METIAQPAIKVLRTTECFMTLTRRFSKDITGPIAITTDATCTPACDSIPVAEFAA